MTEFSTKEIIKGNTKLLSLSNDKTNEYKFNIIKHSVDKVYLLLSIFSMFNNIPYECEPLKIRNGLYNYYIEDIEVSLNFIIDNNLWHFLKIDISKYFNRIR